MVKDRPYAPPRRKRLWPRLLAVVALLGLVGAGVVAGFVSWNYVRLPEVTELKTIEFIEPLKVYTRDGRLISEIGEIKRTPVAFSDIPEKLQQAFMAAEDARFYEHLGIDSISMVRAAVQYISGSDNQTGASTITMQLARGFYLSNERTLWRKFREILLAIKIELELPKQKIFELYLNKIFLGHKSYGIAAAALTYYNAQLSNLTLAQMASIAALPKAPSTLNPISNPKRSLERRNWIIGRMLELGYIDAIDAVTAKTEPIDANPYEVDTSVLAGYVAENVRLELLKPGFLTEEGVTTGFLYGNGIRIYTTIDSQLQREANRSSFNGLLEYEERHGFKKPIIHYDLFDEQNLGYQEPVDSYNQFADVSIDKNNEPLDLAGLRHDYPQLDDILEKLKTIENYSDRMLPALAVRISDTTADLLTATGEHISLNFDKHFPFAGEFIRVDTKIKVNNFNEVLRPGNVVYLRRQPYTPAGQEQGAWRLAQAPSAQTALISIDPSDGSILAMVGGADFGISQYNRATQAERLIGSNIKPLIYAYGFEHGLAPGSVFVDGPITSKDGWRPQNYGLSFLGPVTLRRALALSRNMVSIRVLDHLGINPVANFIENLDITTSPPRDLSLALGTASFSPLNAARSMAMFVNGGHLVDTQLIETVLDNNRNLLYARPSLGICMQKLVNQYQPSQREQERIQAQEKIASAPESAGKSMDTQTAPGLTTQVDLGQSENEGLFDLTWAGRYCADNQAAPPRPIDHATSYLLHNILSDVISYGTAKRAKVLKRTDYAGKTGTTNNTFDAWFTGIHPMIVTTVWLGFDSPSTLGLYESGSRAALPAWINYMRQVQDRIPVIQLKRPNQILSAHIDPHTGDRVHGHFPGARRELFTPESVPQFTTKILLPQRTQRGGQILNRPEDIF